MNKNPRWGLNQHFGWGGGNFAPQWGTGQGQGTGM